jgi:hypothetical protein
MGDWKPLPLTGDPYANVEGVELDGVSAHIQDAYVNELGHTVKRPGLEEFVVDYGDIDAESIKQPIIGLHWDENSESVVAVTQSGAVWKIESDGTATDVSSGTTLTEGKRVSFATDRTNIYMANGSAILQMPITFLPLGNATTQMADAQAPTTVTHLATLDGYLIATAGGRAFQFSDPTDMTSWVAVDTATKAGRPDDLIAIYEGWSELMLVGQDSVEIWYNDGATPFVRRVNGLIPTGCSAPYTFKQVGNHWMWLDQKRRFVKLDTRTPTHISFPYHKLIQTFPTVSDAVSDNMEVSGFPLYVTSFPIAKTTLTYNYQTEGWAQWGYWNTDTAEYESFRGHSYCYAKAWNFHLVGDREDSRIYKLTKDCFTDDGDPIRTQRRTGFISHGMYQEKHSSEIVLRFLRGQGNSDVSDPVVTLRWRNHNGAWSNERQLRLGQVGDHYLEARTHKLGSYKFRQYEITHTDACDFVLVDAQENIE